MSQEAAFFGSDWDEDVLDRLPTLVRPRSDSMVSHAEAFPANDDEVPTPRRPMSGMWVKRDDAHDLAIPLTVKWVDPIDILEELRRDPVPFVPPANRTMEVLPWDVELVEDQIALQEMLKPPAIYGALPVYPVKVPRTIPKALVLALGVLLGFGCATLGFVAVLALFG